MIRVLGDRRPGFVLDTETTTYAFRILPTGQPEHLYYGPRIAIADEAALEHLTERHAFPPGNTVVYDPAHPEYTLEDLCLEFSGVGKGDLREPFVEITGPDGGRTSDFVFLRATVTGDAPPPEGMPGAYSEDGRAEHLTAVYRDKNYGLLLEQHYALFGECLCRWSVLLNESAAPVTVERLMSCQLDLPESGLAVTGFFGAWAREMQRRDVTLPAGKFVIESRAGCSSSRANPFFVVRDPAADEDHGACWGFNLFYSGSHYAAVEAGAYGKTRIVTGLNPHQFSFRLEPGERLASPQAVTAYSGLGFTGLSRVMHEFVREHVVRGEWKRRIRPVLLNSWEACYFSISESGLTALARAAKAVGVELLVMDDGWFIGRADDSHALGDWDPDPKKLPGGLKGLADKVRAQGLDLGIWVEPEMVSVQSGLYRAHPEWAVAIPGKDHSEGRNQRLLDLANPAVQDYLIEKMTEVFSSADIRYVKWDYNRVFSDLYSPYLPPERQGETMHRWVLGLYRVLEALTARFPRILFEGCASGGNRFDLGILSYCPQIWASDNTDAISRARIQEGYSYGYPLSVVAAHVSSSPNHQTLRDTPFDTRFHVAAFGLLGYEYDLRDVSGEKRRTLAAQIERYKHWRDVLQTGRFYRGRTGDLHEWTCVSPDGKRAVGLLLTEHTTANMPNERFFPRGLDPARTYRFWSEERKVNVKRFGSLINTAAPIRVKQDSLVHGVIDRVVKMPGEHEDVTATGAALCAGGVKLHQAFVGTGYDERVRFFPDYFSRMYFMEAID